MYLYKFPDDYKVSCHLFQSYIVLCHYQCYVHLSKLLFFSLILLQLWSIGLISQFLDHFTDSRTPWTGDQLVARPLPKRRTT
jgi:hypothetical protein